MQNDAAKACKLGKQAKRCYKVMLNVLSPLWTNIKFSKTLVQVKVIMTTNKEDMPKIFSAYSVYIKDRENLISFTLPCF